MIGCSLDDISRHDMQYRQLLSDAGDNLEERKNVRQDQRVWRTNTLWQLAGKSASQFCMFGCWQLCRR